MKITIASGKGLTDKGTISPEVTLKEAYKAYKNNRLQQQV